MMSSFVLSKLVMFTCGFASDFFVFVTEIKIVFALYVNVSECVEERQSWNSEFSSIREKRQQQQNKNADGRGASLTTI